MAQDNPVREQALAWAVRTGDPHFEEWDRFTLWLEEDATHADAYDRVMASLAEAGDALHTGHDRHDPAAIRAENEEVAPLVTRRWWIGGAIAACVALLAAFGVWQMQPGSYSLETRPGETRIVMLSDGGQITMAGGTRIVLYEKEPRRAALEQGQALFTIIHDDTRPFRLTVGEDRLVDVGTVFDVKHTDDMMSVAVAEGAVIFNPRGQNVMLEEGAALTSPTGSDDYRLFSLPIGQIGEWAEGRLTFRDARLAELAADLTRVTGVEFTVAREAADQRVSGSVLLDPVRRDPGVIGPLLGVNVQPEGDGWVIGAP